MMKWVATFCTIIFVLVHSVTPIADQSQGMPELCSGGQRYCVTGASCIGDTCVCQSGFGDGFFQCLEAGQVSCRLSGDPHMETFSGSRSSIDIPCRHQLTIFERTDASSGSTCRFTVNGLAVVVDQGLYYEREADLQLQVTDAMGATSNFFAVMSQRFGAYQLYVLSRKNCEVRTPDIIIDVTPRSLDEMETALRSRDHDSLNPLAATELGARQCLFTMTGRFRVRLFDTNSFDTVPLGGVQILVGFDPVDMFFVVSVPACNTDIRFRPFDSARLGNQLRVPGISIVTMNPVFPPNTNQDAQLCATTRDSRRLFRMEADTQGLDSPRLDVLNRFLGNMALFMDQIGDFATSCQESQMAYADCPPDRRMGALNLCGLFLSKSSIVDCLNKANMDFVTAFNDCMAGYCQRDMQRCTAAQNTLSTCRSIDLGCNSL